MSPVDLRVASSTPWERQIAGHTKATVFGSLSRARCTQRRPRNLDHRDFIRFPVGSPDPEGLLKHPHLSRR